MPEASNTIDIGVPPNEVFAFLADGETGLQWRSGVLDIHLKSGDGLGAVYEQGVRGPFGKRVDADYEITDFEPGRRIGFRAISGPVRPEGSYDLATAEGGTRLTFSLKCTPRGIAKLMSPMVAKTMRTEVAQLERLRDVLER
jgi:hypothetical protein